MQKKHIFRMVMVSVAENQRHQHGAGKRDQNPLRCQSVQLFPRGLHLPFQFRLNMLVKEGKLHLMKGKTPTKNPALRAGASHGKR